jgi:hypothetical protein
VKQTKKERIQGDVVLASEVLYNRMFYKNYMLRTNLQRWHFACQALMSFTSGAPNDFQKSTKKQHLFCVLAPVIPWSLQQGTRTPSIVAKYGQKDLWLILMRVPSEKIVALL